MTKMFRKLVAFISLLAFMFGGVGPVTVGAAPASNPQNDKVIFFVSDGLRQDLVEAYAGQGLMPSMNKLLRSGAKAADGGLLTQAPPNTGAGWYSLATGAWPGVHGSTNNTFAINGAAFSSRTSSFDAGVVQAETLAQAAERGGKKVAQIEWAGGRVGVINGPTVDYISFFSGRGVSTNYISSTDDATFVASFGLQFDHPAGFAGQPAFPAASPAPAAGWTNTPQTYSPAKEMRLRVLDFGTDKYGLMRTFLIRQTIILLIMTAYCSRRPGTEPMLLQNSLVVNGAM